MKGLLLKDYYVVTRTCKVQLLVNVVFIIVAIIANANDHIMILAMPVLIAGDIPITLIAIDEKSRWTEYSGALPYSTAQKVLSKYITGLIYVLLVCGIMFLAALCFNGSEFPLTFMFSLALAGALLIPSLMIPLCYKFGVNNGMLIFLILLFIIMFIFQSIFSTEEISAFLLKCAEIPAPIFVLAGIAVYGASFGISTALGAVRGKKLEVRGKR